MFCVGNTGLIGVKREKKGSKKEEYLTAKLAVIVPVYKNEHLTEWFVNQLKDQSYESFTCKVIDGSQSRSVAESWMKGIRETTEPYLLFCNNDVAFTTKDFLKKLVRIFKKNPTCLSPISQGTKVAPDRIGLTGHCFLVNRLLLDIIPFDTSFAPFYWEDVDFCWRLRKHDCDPLITTDVSVVHFSGQTTGLLSYAIRKQAFHDNKERFCEKHHLNPDAIDAVRYSRIYTSQGEEIFLTNKRSEVK